MIFTCFASCLEEYCTSHCEVTAISINCEMFGGQKPYGGDIHNVSKYISDQTCVIYYIIAHSNFLLCIIQKQRSFHFYHGASVICEKYRSLNIFNFVVWRNPTKAQKSQYQRREYKISDQIDTENVICTAKKVSNGTLLNIPVYLSHPRGQPVKKSCKRKKYWF